MNHRIVALAASGALLAGGCSIVATSGGPDVVAGPKPPDCSTSKVPVYVDSALSAGAVGTSLFLGLAALANSNKREELGYATLFTLLGSVPFAVSGIIGGVRVKSCRKAHQDWRMMQMQPPPGAYPYPAPGAHPPPP